MARFANTYNLIFMSHGIKTRTHIHWEIPKKATVGAPEITQDAPLKFLGPSGRLDRNPAISQWVWALLYLYVFPRENGYHLRWRRLHSLSTLQRPRFHWFPNGEWVSLNVDRLALEMCRMCYCHTTFTKRKLRSPLASSWERCFISVNGL